MKETQKTADGHAEGGMQVEAQGLMVGRQMMGSLDGKRWFALEKGGMLVFAGRRRPEGCLFWIQTSLYQGGWACC